MRKKKCRICQKIKSITKFYKQSYMTKKKGLVYYYAPDCDKCSTIAAQKKYVYNREHTQEVNLMRNFGLSKRDYRKISDSQDNVCAICGNPETAMNLKTKRVLAVDHCHRTNIVRGLLCSKCNMGLGAFDDDLDVMASAISYLVNSRVKLVS